ncbi:MAG: hypothetical protein ABR538_11795 [Candidatus Binatia bacterium]
MIDMTLDGPGGRPLRLFDHHMVLQRDTVVPVWGKAAPGEAVQVTIASQTKSTVAGLDGRWRVELDPFPAGGPYNMAIVGNSTVRLADILFGDVWVMAGQSNLMIKRPRSGEMDQSPEARVFKRTWEDRPGDVPFNFARVMNLELGVPIGVLQRTMRGSSGLVRTWLGPEAANSTDPVILEIVNSGNFGQSYASVIEGVAGLAIKGVIWWQGEADLRSRSDPGELYGHIFPAVIQSWRSAWQQGPFPFLFVQEPVGRGYQPEQVAPDPLPDPNPTPRVGRLRQAYLKALELEQTQVITSADLVGGLHPKDREGYVDRIQAAVLGFVYGYEMTFAGPTFQGMTIEDGNRVRLRFRQGTATGLHARGGPLQGFSISGDGETFVWANSVIEGEEVLVWHDSIPAPAVVRYGYDLNFTFANLFNESGMACPTFTTELSPSVP